MRSIIAKWNVLIWDAKTVTAADFTVEISISQACWDKWKKDKTKQKQFLSFHDYFKSEIEH